MSSGPLKLLAGAGGIAEPVYVDDVFSTFLYEGNNTSRNIVNGIDLADKGGLVWTKNRDDLFDHVLVDSTRGLTNSPWLRSNTNEASGTDAQGITVFNSNGYTVGTSYAYNASNQSHVSWTFAKQEKFFDIVTYTGDGTSSRSIAHSLGATPGFVIIKRTDATSKWACWVRDSDGSRAITALDLSSDSASGVVFSDYWMTGMSSTAINLGKVADTGSGNSHNVSSGTYVAYIFAHNNGDGEFGEDGDEDIIKCGTFNAGSTAFVEDLGFEPQWLLVKKAEGTGSWQVIDNMRGSKIDKNGDHASQSLIADNNGTENSEGYSFGVANTGIGVEIADGNKYVYMAIRRSHKPASEFTADKMFKAQSLSAGEGSDTFISTGFPVDMVWTRKKSGTGPFAPGTRLQGGQKSGPDLMFDVNDAEGTNSGMFFLDHSDGATVDFAGGHFNVSPAATNTDYIRYFFRRAKGYFDVVAYEGNGTNGRTVTHNLGAVPELYIVKRRSSTGSWYVYSSATGNQGASRINSTSAVDSASALWNSTSPTASVFSVSSNQNVNASSHRYIAYLFATADGISKVGSYTGTGTTNNIDCGFSNGASLVLIKRTDSADDWMVYDSARGISSGANDPYLILNGTQAEVTSTNYIDPLSSGFTLTSSAPSTLNGNGGEYIFLAIAQDYQL